MLDLNGIVAAIAAHNWLAAAMVFALWLRTLCSSKSNFPVTLKPGLLPVFSALTGGLVVGIGTAEAGKTLTAALMAGFVGALSAGFLDGLLAAIFGSAGSAPAWARAIVGIVDSVTAGSSESGSGSGKAPPARGFAAVRTLVALSIGGIVLAACGLFGQVAAPITDCGGRIATDAAKGMTVVQIVEDVGGPCSMDILQVVTALLASKDPAVTASKAYGEAKAIAAAAAKAGP